jgi:hypothetical protein
MTKKSEILAAIRRHCLDCCCEAPSEVARCGAKTCPLHAYRMGRDPAPARTVSATQFSKNPTPGGEEIQPMPGLKRVSGVPEGTKESAP